MPIPGPSNQDVGDNFGFKKLPPTNLVNPEVVKILKKPVEQITAIYYGNSEAAEQALISAIQAMMRANNSIAPQFQNNEN